MLQMNFHEFFIDTVSCIFSFHDNLYPDPEILFTLLHFT